MVSKIIFISTIIFIVGGTLIYNDNNSSKNNLSGLDENGNITFQFKDINNNQSNIKQNKNINQKPTLEIQTQNSELTKKELNEKIDKLDFNSNKEANEKFDTNTNTINNTSIINSQNFETSQNSNEKFQIE
jgi:hypothetical protein